jgi:predicted DNA-binding protein (MmcQ/YjbR family)
MAMDVDQAVRAICLSFPEAEEKLSHGSPDFRVRGKTFATYVVNHHGDGRVALWLNTSHDAQHAYCEQSPKHFFVPPYVGPRGWLGVHLDHGLAWTRIAQLVREAYERVAPAPLVRSIGKTIAITEKVEPLTAVQKDPLQSKRGKEVVAALGKICLELPETSEGTQFGTPVWRAGKKVFASAYAREGELTLAFWIGSAGQAAVTQDARYHVPPYTGHNGWIALDVTRSCDWAEVRSLALTSYRHYALQRMLAKLGAQDAPAPRTAPATVPSRVAAGKLRRRAKP